MRAALAIVMSVATAAHAESLQLESPSVVVLDSGSGDLVLDKDADRGETASSRFVDFARVTRWLAAREH